MNKNEKIAKEIVALCEKKAVTMAPVVRFTNGKPNFMQRVCLKYLANNGLVIDIQIQDIKVNK